MWEGGMSNFGNFTDKAGSWVDFGDRTTWFCDADCTVPALFPAHVRYIKNKIAGGPVTHVYNGLEVDSDGRVYVDLSKDEVLPIMYPDYIKRVGHLHALAISHELDPELERRCMQGVGTRKAHGAKE